MALEMVMCLYCYLHLQVHLNLEHRAPNVIASCVYAAVGTVPTALTLGPPGDLLYRFLI